MNRTPTPNRTAKFNKKTMSTIEVINLYDAIQSSFYGNPVRYPTLFVASYKLWDSHNAQQQQTVEATNFYDNIQSNIDTHNQQQQRLL
jgi:hypothetical protein